MKFQVAYIPIGVPTFHLESAQKEFDRSIELLKSVTDNCIFPEKMLLTIPDLVEYLGKIHPDLIVLQNLTFANAAYAGEVLKRFDCPVLLWTLREPVIDGGRLRLNSLTGAFSAANLMATFQTKMEYIFGGAEEEKVKKKIISVVKAVRVKAELKALKIAAIGHTPQGFGFGRALDAEMLHNFGVTLESIEVRELMQKAKMFSDEECLNYLKETEELVVDLDQTPPQNVLDHAKLYKAYKDYVTTNNIGAVASRCWPDFFTEYGTPVCSVLSMLNVMGAAASCETDVYGALSMYVGMKLSDKPVFFGDPVSMDETENTVTFWHCGMAACTLARKDTGALIGVHPNRKIGPVMDFGCQAYETATIFRIGRLANAKFRFFIAKGEILDKPKQFQGTSLVVQTKCKAEDMIYDSIKKGWEPHFVVAYGDIAEELKVLAQVLDMEICEY